MNPTYNPGPDDALYFLNTSDNSTPDLFDTSEDPTGRTVNPNALPQFNHGAKKSAGFRIKRTPTTLTMGGVPRARQL